jgi:hypothetical protein
MPDLINAEQSTPVGTQQPPVIVDTTPAEDPQTIHERAMFNRFVQDQGQKIPANFKSADDWFNSLMEARKGFTQARQEIAALKQQYNQNGMNNPNYVGDSSEPVQPQKTEDLSGVPEELSIKPPEPKPQAKVTSEDWLRWGSEIDTTGAVSEATRKEIADKMGAEDVIIEQLIQGRKALAKQSWQNAADVVGGNDNLKRLFKWAQETKTVEEIDAINKSLRTNAYKNVLLGLQAEYGQTTSKPPSQEPKPTQNRVNSSQVPNSVQVFTSMQQQQMAIRDPRYRVDPNYRKAVEQMVINTHKFGFSGNR